MKKLILPGACVIIGSVAGGAVAKFLEASPDEGSCFEAECETPNGEGTSDEGDNAEQTDHGVAYVSLENQFVIPVIQNDNVSSFVVVSLSLEIKEGSEEVIYSKEPKLQDSLLRVMFDHAYMGGFNGIFTESQRMISLRSALLEAATSVVGEDITDVLITELIRQEV